MSSATALSTGHDDRRERALSALAEKPDGVVEAIAAKAEVTAAEILAILPRGAATTADVSEFEAIWTEMSGWGEILFIVHTDDIVLEATGSLPSAAKAMAGSTSTATARSAVISARTIAPASPSLTVHSTDAAPVPSGS